MRFIINLNIYKYYTVIWGGLKTDGPHYGDVMLKTLLNAETSPILGFAYDLFFILIIHVKIAMTRGKSAGVRSLHTSKASQRLHAGDLTYAYLVGLFEGDGYFSISKKDKYLAYELGIELSNKDAQLIYKIKSILGVGVVSFRNREGIDMIALTIRNKSHLMDFILPIFDKYPMFSSKQYDYLRFRNSLVSNVIYWKDLPGNFRHNNRPINSVESIISAYYFSAWLVGFMEAEGCFSVYRLEKNRDYLVASFDIAQKNGEVLIVAIHRYLSFTTKVFKDKTNCFRLKVSGVRSIENVVKFLNKAPVKLLGNKRLQYLLWTKQLRKISRYSEKIKIPLNY